eukprot:31755_1
MEEKRNSNVCTHWWKNCKFVHGDDFFIAVLDDELALTSEERDQINENLDPINVNINDDESEEESDEQSEAEGPQFEDWEKYYKTMKNETVNKFEKWYDRLDKVGNMLCCYEWRLPTRYRSTDIELLMCGYYRTNKTNKTNPDDIIILDIIKLLINYYGVMDYFGKRDTFNEWKTIETPHIYRSEIFDYNGLKFCLLLQKVMDFNDQYRILIEFICAPKNMFKQCVIQLSCIYSEKRYKSYGTFSFRKKNLVLEPRKKIFENITFDDIDEMIASQRATFNLYFHEFQMDNKVIALNTKPQLMVLNESIINCDNTQMYKWTIQENDDTQNYKTKEFMIHGFKCQICLSGSKTMNDNTDFDIYLSQLPETCDQIHFSYDI